MKTWGRDGDLPWPTVNPKNRNPDWPPLGYECREFTLGCVRIFVGHQSREVFDPFFPSGKDAWTWQAFLVPPGSRHFDNPLTNRRRYQDPTKAQAGALRAVRALLVATLEGLDGGDLPWLEYVDKPDTNLHVWRRVKPATTSRR